MSVAKTFEVRQCKRCQRNFEAPMTNIMTGGGFYCSKVCSRKANRVRFAEIWQPKEAVVIYKPQ